MPLTASVSAEGRDILADDVDLPVALCARSHSNSLFTSSGGVLFNGSPDGGHGAVMHNGCRSPPESSGMPVGRTVSGCLGKVPEKTLRDV